ncbi:MAG: helix-turn-helix domain-containing protein [Marivibrio sp.]|uniref:helix-turn-helix domain-containing protein n=1 Tax=Marivibrio sp. TaxID=2039719 RepID=UPI0032F06E81
MTKRWNFGADHKLSTSFETVLQRLEAEQPEIAAAAPTTSYAMRVGRRVQEQRKALGLTQAQLAERAGLKQSAVSGIERGSGRHGPTAAVLCRIADALGVPLVIEPASATPSEEEAAVSPPAASADAARVHEMAAAEEAVPLEVETTLPNFWKEAMALRRAQLARRKVSEKQTARMSVCLNVDPDTFLIAGNHLIVEDNPASMRMFTPLVGSNYFSGHPPDEKLAEIIRDRLEHGETVVEILQSALAGLAARYSAEDMKFGEGVVLGITQPVVANRALAHDD